MKYIFIAITALFLLSNCTTVVPVKEIQQKYPQIDSVSIYYSILYLPENTDTALYFRSFMKPIAVIKGDIWVTFFITTDGTAVYLYRGEYYFKAYLNKRFLEKQQEEEFRIN
jgi:hypothetical protein